METDPNTPRKPVVIAGDYRLTRVDGGVKIEVLDYHAQPMVLTDRDLMELLATGQEH